MPYSNEEKKQLESGFKKSKPEGFSYLQNLKEGLGFKSPEQSALERRKARLSSQGEAKAQER